MNLIFVWKKKYKKVIRWGVVIYESGFCLEKLNINHIEKALDWGSKFMNLYLVWKKKYQKVIKLGVEIYEFDFCLEKKIPKSH